jgi:drug/metabolite transporter (DMT)-like permease
MSIKIKVILLSKYFIFYKMKDVHITTANESSPNLDVDVHVTVVPSENSDDLQAVIIDSLNNDNDMTVTPAFPNFPTDEEVVIEPNTVFLLESTNDVSEQENNSKSSPIDSSRPLQQSSSLLEELKYLLKPTNSLARPDDSLQASVRHIDLIYCINNRLFFLLKQEADLAIKRRTIQFEDFANNHERLLIEGLTPQEAKSLGAADRRSIASRGRRSSNTSAVNERPRASIMQPPNYSRPSIQPATIVIAQPEHRTIFNHLSGLFWAFLAAYAFSIILFLTKTFGIDLIFGFFLQMIAQTIAFAVYAFYKGYNLLGPSGHRIAMICRAILIGIGVLTSFLAYYYITLPDLSAIRQSQVILTMILSIFFLHERMTISRIIACVLTIIAIVVLIRPTTVGKSSSSTLMNLTNDKNSWMPYSSPWNSIIGIGFALCTAITYSIASVMNKIYFNTQHLYNSVLCFWSALSALFISIILVYVTHFSFKDARSFPHDWRLFVGIGLGLASIFVFIANQKAIKRERSSIVTLIYATDIILALILQNIFTHIKSDVIAILGRIDFLF